MTGIKIRVGYEMIYDFPQATPMIMVLGTHFTRASDEGLYRRGRMRPFAILIDGFRENKNPGIAAGALFGSSSDHGFSVSRNRTVSPVDGVATSPCHITRLPRTKVPTGQPFTFTPS